MPSKNEPRLVRHLTPALCVPRFPLSSCPRLPKRTHTREEWKTNLRCRNEPARSYSLVRSHLERILSRREVLSACVAAINIGPLNTVRRLPGSPYAFLRAAYDRPAKS